MSNGWRKSNFEGRPRTRGFTLVELLVVVSIIALLVSILLPSLKKAREQARTVKCLANLRSMGTGIHLYAQDHGSMLPGPLHPPIFRNTGGSASGTNGWPAMNPDTERPWFLLYRLAPYFTKFDNYLEYADEVATCPTYHQKNPDENYRRDINAHHYEPASVVGGGPNPSYSRPFHYVQNSWANTAPVFYFGWVNIGTTWTGFENGLCDKEKPYSLNPSGCGVGYYRPKPLDILKNTSAEWAAGDAGWIERKVNFVNPGPGGTQKVPCGTWQVANSEGYPTGPTQFPLLRKPIHVGDRGTNLVYFDTHADTFIGTTSWANKFPANLRAGLKRPPP